MTPRNGGIPASVAALVNTFTYNDIDSLANQLDADTACVIMEPVLFDEPQSSFLQEVRRLCTETGTLLIFDEMWTGFRLALGGAQIDEVIKHIRLDSPQNATAWLSNI